MGTSIVANGASLRSVADYLNIPVMSGLVALQLPGVDGPTSEKNWAEDQANFIGATGSPTYASNSISIKSDTDYFDFGIPEMPSMSILIVGQIVTGTDSAGNQLVSSYLGNQSSLRQGAGGGTSYGTSIFSTNGYLSAYVSYWSGAAGSASNVLETRLPSGLTAGQNKAVMLRLAEPAGTTDFKDLVTGSDANGARASGQLRDLGSGTLREGKQYSVTSIGPSIVEMAIVWDRALSDSELASMAIWVQGYCSRHGITLS